MTIRREQEKWIRERQMKKSKKNIEEQQARKLQRLRKQKMNTASKKLKVYIDGYSKYEDEVMSIPQYSIKSFQNLEIKDSYQIRKSISKGLPPDEGKNTKLTLELLQKLHYKDIELSKKDDFQLQMVTDLEDENEKDSVFDYFFPGMKKKKPKKVKGDNYSERIMNIKREYGSKK